MPMTRYTENLFGAVVPPSRLRPNRFDAMALLIVFGGLALAGIGAGQMLAPLAQVQAQPISLDPLALPGYALRTTLRMLLALGASLVFSLVYASIAAKSRRAGVILIPILDVLQSVPILGFLSFTVAFFLGLFPGSALGAECAAIFAIFTSQAWNLTFSFYTSLRLVPRDLEEVCRSFRFSPWQRFWGLDVPFAIPGLVWNAMMSMSGGWFFVVASEAISVGNQTIVLPGVGSYVATAIAARDTAAIGWALATMFFVILLTDQLLFRPLLAWSEKFRAEQRDPSEAATSWFLRVLQQTKLLRAAALALGTLGRLRFQSLAERKEVRPSPRRLRLSAPIANRLWFGCVGLAAAYGLWRLASYISSTLTLADVGEAVMLGSFTLARVLILILLASLIWVPIGILVGLRPRLAQAMQPMAQFLAAFPANLLFPLFVIGIVRFGLDPDIWLSPLMVLGTQWYILFNVVAGASAFPGDLLEASRHFRLGGWLWWRKVILPGVFPYYITGAVTASGGSWNASIVAEAVNWGSTHLQAAGLGAYIATATTAGDFPRIVLGIAVMSTFVVLFNRFLWRPLFDYAEARLRMN